MSTEFNVLLLCKDLFFSSQLHGAVQRAGRTGRTCLSQEGCLAQISATAIDYVIIDLELPQLNLRTLREAAGPDCQLIAFGPHVREDLFQAAKDAGCDAVLTRGQACSVIERLLNRSTE